MKSIEKPPERGERQNIDITALDTFSLSELAALPAAILRDLQDASDNALALARKRKAALDDALDRRYGPVAQAARLRDGKDTGTVRLPEGEHTVVAETKKSVYWDQPKLAEIALKIEASGESAAVYIVTKTELTVREASYAAWPEEVRAAFEPARTVKAGKPVYRIELNTEREAA